MEEHRDEHEEAGYQLMMDVFTRSMDDTPPPSRWWKGVGIVLVVLGGVAGLLLATGHRPNEPPESRRPLMSTAGGPAAPLQAQGFQERATLLIPTALSPAGTPLPALPEEASRPAGIPLAVDARTSLGPRGVAASPPASARAKASRARPSLMRQSKRGCDCPEPDRLPRVARQQALPRSQRSLVEEFDPNAERVRSAP